MAQQDKQILASKSYIIGEVKRKKRSTRATRIQGSNAKFAYTPEKLARRTSVSSKHIVMRREPASQESEDRTCTLYKDGVLDSSKRTLKLRALRVRLKKATIQT